MNLKSKKVTILLGMMACALSSPALRANEIVMDDLAQDELQTVKITPSVVRALVESGHADVREVSEEEAIAAAERQGVRLEPTSGGYGHPWVIIKTGIGLPNLVGAEIEIYVHANWTVSVGTGAGLLPSFYMAAVRWRPDATCWGCHGKNTFSIAFGIEPGIIPKNVGAEYLISGIADLAYTHRFAEHFGFILGLKLGGGPTFGLGDPNFNGRVQPAITAMLYIGPSF